MSTCTNTNTRIHILYTKYLCCILLSSDKNVVLNATTSRDTRTETHPHPYRSGMVVAYQLRENSLHKSLSLHYTLVAHKWTTRQEENDSDVDDHRITHNPSFNASSACCMLLTYPQVIAAFAGKHRGKRESVLSALLSLHA